MGHKTTSITTLSQNEINTVNGAVAKPITSLVVIGATFAVTTAIAGFMPAACVVVSTAASAATTVFLAPVAIPVALAGAAAGVVGFSTFAIWNYYFAKEKK